MPKWTGKKANVVFTKPAEPSFLKKFKEKVGYKEKSDIEEKFQKMPKATDEDLEDSDDELPQVVQLNPGDISGDEYKHLIGKDEKEEKTTNGTDLKILFRKPESKRTIEENELKQSTKKMREGEMKKEREEKEEEKEEKKKKKKKEKSNRKLLSFVDEDDI